MTFDCGHRAATGRRCPSCRLTFCEAHGHVCRAISVVFLTVVKDASPLTPPAEPRPARRATVARPAPAVPRQPAARSTAASRVNGGPGW